ncbi:hypothetical protein Anas_04969 [Armadillidium nasatum]|uniref:CHK kinase-like domain-containing protein n=1 Tax=Armadillidium nasatum TaxID=96803 RepID=A0A5N5T1D4_9CRUS|nr:hypothetical protein Anas_04969 [Armadillidium nasatum]
MNEFNLLDEYSVPENPYALVTEELVKDALKNDKGSDVTYQNNGAKLQDYFVAKLNPLRPDSAFTEAMEQLYTRETVILSSIIGGMNKQLKTLKLDKIKTPKLLSRSIEKGKEAFIAENLKTQGFRMYDRRIGLDLNHTLLVLNELGRFHASSILLEEELYPKTLLETFKGFERTYLDRNHSSFEGYSKLFSAAADNAKNFLQNADPKYEECVKWLKKHRHEMVDIYLEAFSTKKPFDVLTHCDCWTNNFLFRYNEDEIPVDIRFVDLQLAVKGSPAADLNYFFYTSINKDFRLKNLNTMLTTYYESFCNVLRRGGRQPPFTYPELKEEIKDKKLFGFVCGLLILPIILGEGEEIFDVSNFTADKIDEFNQQQSKKFEKLAQREGPFKDRYLVMFDEMIESNVFKEN